MMQYVAPFSSGTGCVVKERERGGSRKDASKERAVERERVRDSRE
jgi:hypothetical protein